MRVVVFGVGKCFMLYEGFIKQTEIVCLVDNDFKKQSSKFLGYDVKSPDVLTELQYDFVVIMIYKYQQVISQLESMGINKERICVYNEIFIKLQLKPVIYGSHGDTLLLSEWIELENTWKKTVFIVIHSFGYHGVPIAVYNLSLLLIDMGYRVVVGTMDISGANNKTDYRLIPLIPCVKEYIETDGFDEIAKTFDRYIIGTLAAAEAGNALAERGMPTVWWIHESTKQNYEDYPIKEISLVHKFAVVGKRAADCLYKYYGITEPHVLHYYIPERDVYQKETTDKVVISCIGTFISGKAQDVLVSSLEMISDSFLKDIEVRLAGGISKDQEKYWQEVSETKDYINICGKLTKEEISVLYSQTDILVCPSRADTMPIVVTEAMQWSIPCIVSDQVGQSEFIMEYGGGIVTPVEDVKALSDAIITLAEDADLRNRMGEEGRRIYERFFSKEYARKELEILLK